MARRISSIAAFALAIPFAAQAQKADQVQPGQWEAVVTVNSIDMPGAPPQVAQMMGQRMRGAPTRTSYCITAEQAAKGPQEMIKQNPSCRFTQFSMRGGMINTQMSCSQNGGTMTARATGSYTPTSFNVTSSAVVNGPMSMRMTTTTSGKRVGPCAGAK